MPTDQNLTAPDAATPAGAVSAIENELPAYRAISPGAVFSLVLGILAVLCYAHLFFLLFAAGAVLLGVLADRKIQRLPDVLTGRGLAQAGIALGLVFGLTAFTITTVQNLLIRREAGKFARQYQVILTKGTVDDALWYGQPPAVRKDKTPEALVTEMKKASRDPQMMEMRFGQIYRLKEAVGAGGAAVRFLRIERSWDDGTNLGASALFQVDQAAPKPPAEKQSFALAILKGHKEKSHYEWWVEEVQFPYRPNTYVTPEKPVDDGHGHNQEAGGGAPGGHEGHSH